MGRFEFRLIRFRIVPIPALILWMNYEALSELMDLTIIIWLLVDSNIMLLLLSEILSSMDQI